jgi:hypothetical protein
MLLHFDSAIFCNYQKISVLSQNRDPLDPLVTHSRGSWIII